MKGDRIKKQMYLFSYASGGALFEKSSAKTFRLHPLLPFSPVGAERQKGMLTR